MTTDYDCFHILSVQILPFSYLQYMICLSDVNGTSLLKYTTLLVYVAFHRLKYSQVPDRSLYKFSAISFFLQCYNGVFHNFFCNGIYSFWVTEAMWTCYINFTSEKYRRKTNVQDLKDKVSQRAVSVECGAK